MKIKNKFQYGVVSIFIVVFSALLMTVVTISFVSLMMKDQTQVMNADLSNSAYDSAMAGVEDAKRALSKYQTICDTSSKAACDAARAAIDSTTSPNLSCNAAVDTLSDIIKNANGEVDVKTGTSDTLNQAYTCVKMALDTSDYLGSLGPDGYDFIPLNGVSAFDSIKIDWFTSADLDIKWNNVVDVINATAPASQPLLAQASWPENRPGIIQAQLIQYGSNGFTVNSFNPDATGQSNTYTVFLYPVRSVTPASYAFATLDNRQISPASTPTPVRCVTSLAAGGYACSITLTLPTPINGGNRTAFLNIGSLYNASSFRVSLYNGAASVNFNGVQPEIDSTGRANDLFRRVVTRVRLDDVAFPYPTAAVSSLSGICKTFSITDDAGDYSGASSCP